MYPNKSTVSFLIAPRPSQSSSSSSSFCVCAHVCVGVNMCGWIQVCVNVEARGQCWVSSSVIFHLIFSDRLSHQTWSSPIWLYWLDNTLQRRACLCLSGSGVRHVPLHVAILYGFWRTWTQVLLLVKCGLSWLRTLLSPWRNTVNWSHQEKFTLVGRTPAEKMLI